MLSLLKKFFGVGDKPTEQAPYKVEPPATKVESLPAGTEAANITAVYIAPEAVATTPIPLVVELPVAAPAKVAPESIKDEVNVVVTAPKKVAPKQAAPKKQQAAPKKQQFEKKAEATKAPPKPRAPRKPVAK